MAFPIINPNDNEYINPTTGVTYTRGPNDVWNQKLQNIMDPDDVVSSIDARYLQLTGGTVTGELVLDRPGDGQGFTIKGHDDAGDEVNLLSAYHNSNGSPDAINYIGRTDSDTNIQTKSSVENIVKDYVPLTGATLTGNLTLSESSGLYTSAIIKSSRISGYAFQVKPDENTSAFIHTNGNAQFKETNIKGGKLILDQGSGFDTCLEIKKYDGDAEDRRKVTAELKTNGVWDLRPTVTGGTYAFSIRPDGYNDGDVAFRVTGDGTVKAGHNTDSPFMAKDANDVVTLEYLNKRLLRPAHLAWKWSTNTETSTPPSQYFKKSEYNGITYLRFSYQCVNNCNLGDGKFNDTNVSFSDGPIGTIWELMSNGKFKLKKQFRASNWRWNFTPSGSTGSHFEFGLSSHHGHDWNTLVNGHWYYVTVGGFF